jgi:hypothetical protein
MGSEREIYGFYAKTEKQASRKDAKTAKKSKSIDRLTFVGSSWCLGVLSDRRERA